MAIHSLRLQEILQMMEKTSLKEFLLQEHRDLLWIKREGLVQADGSRAHRASHHCIRSPHVGRFYPRVTEGTAISSDTLVGVITALGVDLEIESKVEGIVTKVLPNPGSPVEYGQPLLIVRVKGASPCGSS